MGCSASVAADVVEDAVVNVGAATTANATAATTANANPVFEPVPATADGVYATLLEWFEGNNTDPDLPLDVYPAGILDGVLRECSGNPSETNQKIVDYVLCVRTDIDTHE